jgi:hypothetical protein
MSIKMSCRSVSKEPGHRLAAQLGAPRKLQGSALTRYHLNRHQTALVMGAEHVREHHISSSRSKSPPFA